MLDIGESLSLNLMRNNRKYNKLIQSAGNCLGSSETTRQLSDNIQKNLREKEEKRVPLACEREFAPYLAGVLDGDGNFDLRRGGAPIGEKKRLFLRAIRIKLHCRDVRILTRIQNQLHRGRISYDKNKPHVLYILSSRVDMEHVINLVNGYILIKCESFKKACQSLAIKFKEGQYTLPPGNPYLAGLVDTAGSVVFNFPGNRIECNLEFQYTKYTKQLCLDQVIPHYKPAILLRDKKITGQPGKVYKSIAFKFQTVGGMIFLYQAFMKNRLYCDMKFYRISSIKRFLSIRHYRNQPDSSLEYKIYADFLLKWIQYENPHWIRVPFAVTLLERTATQKSPYLSDKDIVQK